MGFFFLHVKQGAFLPKISRVTSLESAGVTIPVLVREMPLTMTNFQSKHNNENRGDAGILRSVNW
jgi:hypothetical protein